MPFCHFTLSAIKPTLYADSKGLKTIGDHLRKRRLDLGLSQSELAKILAVDLSTVNHWEKNINVPTADHLAQINEFLGYVPPAFAQAMVDRLIHQFQTLKMNLRKLTQYLGVDEATLICWQQGKDGPPSAVLSKIESLLLE